MQRRNWGAKVHDGSLTKKTRYSVVADSSVCFKYRFPHQSLPQTACCAPRARIKILLWKLIPPCLTLFFPFILKSSLGFHCRARPGDRVSITQIICLFTRPHHEKELSWIFHGFFELPRNSHPVTQYRRSTSAHPVIVKHLYRALAYICGLLTGARARCPAAFGSFVHPPLVVNPLL